MIREFVKGNVSVDGRNIGYRLFMANDYFKLKYNLSEEEVDKIIDEQEDLYNLVGQILALKQSMWLLDRTSHSCGSLTDSLWLLEARLIKELKEKHNHEFDNNLVNKYYCE